MNSRQSHGPECTCSECILGEDETVVDLDIKIMDKIEDEFNTQYRENQEIDDPYIFNVIDEWEFMDWVKDNYNIKWDEEIRHYFVP